MKGFQPVAQIVGTDQAFDRPVALTKEAGDNGAKGRQRHQSATNPAALWLPSQ
jgi:hypothetical protein